ncbi:MAG TPA: Tol-Pal system beta propeller repeat protein TolB [Desulfobacteraceae bacterium]|nr:Tol-Pal system beta propeller repeat protein TolB [Desulfobacteraceae bacterium]
MIYRRLRKTVLSKYTLLEILLCCLLFAPGVSYGRIYIDINAPSIRKFNIAIPDFRKLKGGGKCDQLSTKLSAVITNDLDLSGFFSPMDKASFIDEISPLTREDIRFKNWSVIGAELLLTGGYTCIGSRLEVEIRLFDVFLGKQILGKRALGEAKDYRYIMHRLGNEIIRILTGHDGMFLTKLAFVGNGTGHKEIYACDFDGHNVRRITADKSIALLPRWSPDGKGLLYNSYREGGPMLYFKNFRNGYVRRISGRKGLNIGAAWMPGGKRLALTLSYRGNPDIFVIDLQGKILKRLTRHWGIDVSPSFSPDGKKVAFVSNRSGSPQIYIMDLVKGTEERLTFEGKYNTSPAWSSLNRIAFTSLNHGHYNIVTIDPSGGQTRQLTEDQGNNEDPCWSPDGHYLAFSSNREGRYHLYIMTASGQNQRRVTSLKGDQTAPSWSW